MASQKNGSSQQQEEQGVEENIVPQVMVEQAEAAAASEHDPTGDTPAERRHMGHDVPTRVRTDLDVEQELPDHPPPAYGEHFGSIVNEQEGFGTKADVAEDGRVNIRINQRNRQLSNLLVPALRHQQDLTDHEHVPPPPYIPPSLGGAEDVPPPPPLNLVIQVVGSRGDVQPFVALGKVLKETYGHRVRLATHPNFQQFVTENGLEFFSIGGDPAELMAFMVKNPGLMPGFDTLRSGDVGNRRREVAEYLKGCWRSCFESGDGSGPEAKDDTVEDWRTDHPENADIYSRPFVADCIIANPPSFAHVHCAEKLGIPLHVMFTMPYSPTQAFPHPLANIQSSNADPHITNYMSYALIDTLTWQGLGDVINRFRQKSLGLEPISLVWAPGMLQRLQIPHTYCWSPALIPKPKDWGQNISIAGFFFLNLASNYTPAPDLKEFLDSGPPPVYIGFGSIVLDDPNAMTQLIFEAVRITGQRVLLSKGWGGMGAEDLGIPDGVFMLGNVPHDWLFEHVSCVVHHGGAGTTAAGITAGKPTVVVPFFGDQPFWGSMVARAGAGPDPLPHKELTGEKLAEAINFCLKPESQEKAKQLAAKIAKETGSDVGAQNFHQMLDIDTLRCVVAPSHVAVWRLKRTQVRLSSLAACTLANEGLLDFNDLKLFRPKEYETDEGPWDPITGGATAIFGTATQIMMGVADFPIETLKGLKIHPDSRRKSSKGGTGEGPSDSKAESETAASADNTTISSSSRDSVASETPITSDPSSPTSIRTNSTLNALDSSGNSARPGSLQTRSTSMSDALKGQLKDARSRSRSSSRARREPPADGGGDPMETAVGTTKGVGRILGAGFKSPMDFTMAVTKGFRNAPKLYGDETVRRTDPVTDFRSGQKVAWKEFGYGLYDGITGLVTQPMKGAQKEGAAGLVKGFGKGIGGIVFKPAAAGFGVAGYTMQGVYKEMHKNFGSSVQNYIIAARTAQGFEDWQNSTEEERRDIVMRWKAMQGDIKRKRNPDELVRDIMDEKKRMGQAWTQDLKTGWGERYNRIRSVSTGQFNRSSDNPTDHDPESAMLQMGAKDANLGHARTSEGQDISTIDKAQLDEAIKQSVQETSQGDPEEDEAVERAINASMAELQKSRAERAGRQQHAGGEEEEDLRRAMEASLTDANAQGGQQIVHDEELERALAQSLKEQRKLKSSDSEWDSDPDTEEDEDYKRALQESKSQAGGAATTQDAPPEYDSGHVAGTTRAAFDAQHGGEKTQQEQDEERIVMEYAKKQSLLEDQHRKAAQGGGQSGEASGS